MRRRRAGSSGRRLLGITAAVGAAAAVGWGAAATGLVVVRTPASDPAPRVREAAAGEVAPAPPRLAPRAPDVARPGAPDDRARDGSAPAPSATERELAELRATLVVPVAGVRRDALVDDFDDARGDGGARPDGPRRHDALDIPAPRGTPVLSAAGGRVVKLFESVAGGLMIYAADASGRFVLLYGHLDAYAPGLAEGAPLRPGQPIGVVGTSGNAAPDAPHLHFAIARAADPSRWWEGTPVNPHPLLGR